MRVYTEAEIEILKEAVIANAWVIRHIDNAPASVEIVALQNGRGGPFFIENVINPKPETKAYALEQSRLYRNPKNNSYADHLITLIKNPTEEDWINACKAFGTAIRYCENPSEQIQLAAVQSETNGFFHIKAPGIEVIRQAFARHSEQMFKALDHGTIILPEGLNRKDLLLLAAKTHPDFALDYNSTNAIVPLTQMTAETLQEAVSRSPQLIAEIPNPSKPVQLACVTAYRFQKDYLPCITLLNTDRDIQNALSARHPGLILDLLQKDDGLQLIAAENHPDIIAKLESPKEKTVLAALKKDGYALQHIKDPTPLMRRTAVEKEGYAIQYINDPREEEQLIAIRRDEQAIEFIKNPTFTVQFEVYRKNKYMFKYIQNPCREVVEWHFKDKSPYKLGYDSEQPAQPEKRPEFLEEIIQAGRGKQTWRDHLPSWLGGRL